MMPQQALLQVIAAIFVLFAISRAYLRFKERKLSSVSFFFWNVVWVVGIFLIFIPDLTTRIANLLGIGRGVDVVLYASIVTLFYLIFRIYIKVEDTQRQITQVVRKVALEGEQRETKPSRKS